MMKLQTQISLEKQSNNLIDYHSNILLLGSCFSENIGEKIEYFKFANAQNPFGILFHPKAIEALIEKGIHEEFYAADDLFFHNEQWHCFDANSKLSASSKDVLLYNLNEQIRLVKQNILKATHIIITLGTSWVYRHIESNTIVANCHKVPQKQFKKELLSVEEISESLKHILSLIGNVNHNVSIVLTVSPVRHLKDGFIENTQSKAHLISAIHHLIDTQSMIGNSQLTYFPSYEILMDELRDYRFYTEDMIHPNQTAINYIWERFKDVWISKCVYKTMDEVDGIQKGIQHKPFNPNSSDYQEFLRQLEHKKRLIQKQFPHITF